MKTGLIFAALIAAASGAANADPRDDALAAMTRCSTLGDRDKRLGCYDATMARVPSPASPAMSPALLPAPPVAAAAAPPRRRRSGFMAGLFGPGGPNRPVQISPAQFGSESIANGGMHAYPAPMDGDTLDEIRARLVDARFDGGVIIVTLDNGQVWRQTAGSDAVGTLSRPAPSYVATIERGNFAGSYAMRLSGRPGVIAVRRIR